MLALMTSLPSGTALAAKEAARAAVDQSTTLPGPAQNSPDEQDLFLQVILNQADRGIVPFTLVDGHLRASVAVLRGIGFTLADRDPADAISLDDIEGLRADYDAGLQQLTLLAPVSLLSLDTTTLQAPTTPQAVASASPGLLLNYDLYASHIAGVDNLTLTPEARVFGFANAVFDTTSVLQLTRDDSDGHWHGRGVRLNSSLQWDFPEPAMVVTVGDFASGAVDWSRSVRLGGVRIARDYGLQPYRLLTPTPTFAGEAALPSDIELYIDGLRQYSGRVPAGPFQLATQPGISGTGQAQIVVTDAFGQSRTLDFSFYSAPQLLAEGVSDWSAELGRLRAEYGLSSFAYDDQTVASATYRKGLSQRLTFEIHGEAGGLGLAGAGMKWQPGNSGVISSAYAWSRQGGRSGGQYALGYSWNNRRFNFSAGTRRTHGHYRDIGSLPGGTPADISDQLVVGINLERMGSVSASYLRLRYPESEASRYASFFWSHNLGRRWSTSLSVNQNLADRSDRSIYFGLSATLDGTRQTSVSLQRYGQRNSITADLDQPVPGDGGTGGFGWRLQARSGSDHGGLAEGGWLTRYGRYTAGLASQGGDGYGYADATGSVVWIGGELFAARDVPDAFAVVSTGDLADIPVRLENRPIGRTDHRGVLLVTPLQPWQHNRLSIDTMTLPANIAADRVETLATPRRYTGIVVDFGLRQVRSAIIVLHDQTGEPLTLGATVQLERHPERVAVIGYDGETYLDNLDDHNRIQVVGDGTSCSAEFDYPAEGSDDIPRIGPLTCQQDRSP